MKLLILDDQKAVVDGLLQKIDWSEIGIRSAVGAYSAVEARSILLEQRIDVMLCDIEMPQENGLSLVKWMRQQDMQTKCIFLTAHADFTYAQKSVSLGAFDYVVQPAPYAQIRDAVERAVKELESEQQQGHLQKYSQVANWKSKREAGDALRDYMLGGDTQAVQEFARRGELPGEDRKVCLIHARVQRWFTTEKWTDDLLAIMLDNAAGEVFDTKRERFVVVMLGNDCFAILLWNEQDDAVGQQLNQQLGFFYNVCRKQLECKIWVDSTSVVQMNQLPALKHRHGEEDEGSDPEEMPGEELPPSISGRWRELLLEGKAQELEAAVRRQLNQKRAQMSEELAITQVWQEMMEAVEAAAGGTDMFWRKVLVDAESYDIYRNAGKSEEALIDLVRLIQQRFVAKGRDRDIVDVIIAYVDAHLDKEIHRSDLAEQVYLNPDHLNRLFKKQTGKTLKEFVSEYKMNEARKMLQITNLPVSIIAAKVGYDNFSHFSYAYKKVTGQSPLESRNAYRAEKEEP